MRFEWDEKKSEETLLKRGIDFIDAAKIWLDPNRQERWDFRGNHGETRMQTIGCIEHSILFVVYTERAYDNGGYVIRIISVRRANQKERAQYEAKTFSMGLLR